MKRGLPLALSLFPRSSGNAAALDAPVELRTKAKSKKTRTARLRSYVGDERPW